MLIKLFDEIPLVDIAVLTNLFYLRRTKLPSAAEYGKLAVLRNFTILYIRNVPSPKQYASGTSFCRRPGCLLSPPLL